MSRYSKEDILRIVAEEDVEFVRLQFTDAFGIFSTNFKINFSTISCIFVKMKCNIMHIVQLFT